MIKKALTAAALMLGLALPAAADPLAKDVFGAFSRASQGAAVSIGFYSQGCAQGPVSGSCTSPCAQPCE